MTAAARAPRERVAWLSLEPPDQHGGGGARRQFFLIDALRSHVDIDVLVVDVPRELPNQLFARLWSRRPPGGAPLVTSSPYGTRVLEHLRREGITTAVVAHVETAALLGGVLSADGVRAVVDMHNVYSRYHAARGERVAAAAWRHLERRVGSAAAGLTVLSHEEAAAFPAVKAPVAVVANGVSPKEWPEPPELGGAEGLAYVGSWQHAPNRTGLAWLLEQVWPGVRREVPTAVLHLYGPGDPPIGAARGVVVHGRAEDLAAALGRHRASLVPIVEGVGTRLKFIESLASGVPVVTTSLGAEGYEIPAGCFLHADDPAAFAAACVRALRGGSDIAQMAHQARQTALTTYSWSSVAGELRRALSG